MSSADFLRCFAFDPNVKPQYSLVSNEYLIQRLCEQFCISTIFDVYGSEPTRSTVNSNFFLDSSIKNVLVNTFIVRFFSLKGFTGGVKLLF